jgi:hypothetical protein
MTIKLTVVGATSLCRSSFTVIGPSRRRNDSREGAVVERQAVPGRWESESF